MLHRRVRGAVMESGRVGSDARNAKGDDVKRFDVVANDAALVVLNELKLSLVVDSEESGSLKIGSSTPRHRLVLDPVDGSDNWTRGLPLSALSCAVLPLDAPLHPDWVEAALVGSLKQETPLIALMGSGAWRGNDRLETAPVHNIIEAMISVELNHHSPLPGLARLMAAARGSALLRLRIPSPFLDCRRRYRRPCRYAWPSDRGKLPRRRTIGDRGGRLGRRPRWRASEVAGKLDRPRQSDRGVEPATMR